MSDWKVGGTYAATPMSRRMINAQMSPLSVSVNSLYIIDDLMVYKERALNTHIVKALPKFMLNTPAMKRRAKAVDTLLERIQSVHTSAQRAGSPRDLADDIPSRYTRATRSSFNGVKFTLRPVGGSDCQRVLRRRLQLYAVLDGVAAGALRQNPEWRPTPCLATATPSTY